MNDFGILDIHGLFGKPDDVGMFKKILASLGMRIVCPMLPGHSSPEDLRKVSQYDYVQWVEEQLLTLERSCPRGIFIIGLSLGGALALIGAQNHRSVKGLVLLSTPVTMPWYSSLAVKLLHKLPVALPSLKGGVFEDKIMASHHTSHNKFYLESVDAYRKIVVMAKAVLPYINIPALIISARKDDVVSSHNAEMIYSTLPSSKKTLLILNRGGHVILEDMEREMVFNTVFCFLRDQIIN